MSSPEHTHVVVVNDNPEFLEMMAEVLADEDYPVTVIDGDRDGATELIRAAVPDALIIDLRLGREELHGWDVLQEVRRDPQLSQLPTLICTGDLRALDRLEGQLTAMRRIDVLRKPFEIDELYAKLSQLVALDPA